MRETGASRRVDICVHQGRNLRFSKQAKGIPYCDFFAELPITPICSCLPVAHDFKNVTFKYFPLHFHQAVSRISDDDGSGWR
jgi:hypothetical protein